MQILGNRSKVLLIAVAIAMLVAIGVSFAMWDISAVKAIGGDLSSYANAKVGDIVKFGNYYQTGNKVNGKYEKTTITWLVVDKDERTGQLTLLSEKILASGSYFGNYYNNSGNVWGAHYDNNTGVGDISYNQAYVDSTVRAYLNNLERLDLGGDEFTAGGYLPSNKNSTIATGLLSSIGFSNQKYWTGQLGASNAILNKSGFSIRTDNDQIYYQRPISNTEYINRPATLGFYNEAFTEKEKSLIVPKAIAGYIGHRWPDKIHDASTKSYVEGAVDKVWLPSVTELNIIDGFPWNYKPDNSDTHVDDWTSPSDEAGSTVFEYFKNYKDYGYSSVAEAVKATRTSFAENSFAMNYSIPIYYKSTTIVNTDIHVTNNSTNHYWTRSPMSYWFNGARTVLDSGLFSQNGTDNSNIGVRPCVILKY